jgi:hypothetical protein
MRANACSPRDIDPNPTIQTAKRSETIAQAFRPGNRHPRKCALKGRHTYVAQQDYLISNRFAVKHNGDLPTSRSRVSEMASRRVRARLTGLSLHIHSPSGQVGRGSNRTRCK